MFHQHFNTPESGGAIRSYYLGRALVMQGHRVVMITSHSAGKKVLSQNVKGIEVYYLPIPYNNRFNFYARSWAFARYVVGAVRLASRFKDFDVSYGLSVPLTVGICTWWLKFRYGIPYLFEVGDLWPDAPVQMGVIQNRLLKRTLYFLEKKIYEQADSIVALSEPIRAAIKNKILNKPIDVIPNMADCEFYSPDEKNADLERKFQSAGKLVVSYLGALGIANGLEYLLDCAEASLQNGLSTQFIICGDGAMADELKQSAKQRQLTNVTFTGFINRAGVREVMNVTDVVFVCYKKVPILETGSPNKYFDGLASGKMIVINFGGWIRSEIEKNACGLFVDPDNALDFVAKMFPIASDRTLLQKVQTAARTLGEKKYSRRLLTDRFASLFSDAPFRVERSSKHVASKN